MAAAGPFQDSRRPDEEDGDDEEDYREEYEDGGVDAGVDVDARVLHVDSCVMVTSQGVRVTAGRPKEFPSMSHLDNVA